MDVKNGESSGGDHSGSEGLQDDIPYPQHPVDPAVFDADWIANIEALDSLDSEQLIAPSTVDGFSSGRLGNGLPVNTGGAQIAGAG